MAKRIGKTRAPARRPARTTPTGGGTPAGPVLVVGIGASAGGLGPISLLLSQLKPGCGLAVILAQHLGPGGDAMLAALGKEKTPLPVVEATDGMPLWADHIYVVPARRLLSVVNGTFSVRDVAPCEGLRMPIDHFLCTLAADRGRRSVGIILSGNGKDGTQGLAEIKAVGGATAAQDPRTAEFPDMPASAIAAGQVDAVLAPEKMGSFLADCLAEVKRLTVEQEEGAGLEAVLSAVRHAIGHDFHCYKLPTLSRRTRRRMAMHQLDNYDDYARMIRMNKDEAAALRKDLLIGVTEFFRQGEAWNVLEEKVVAGLIEKAPPASTIRVWVPACSIGKEAYSVAMLMAERIERSGKKLALQVFATDTDSSAVDIARSGLYAEDDLKGLSQERLERFCVRKSGRYEFVKELRGTIIFAPQDLLADPPFSKLDLITCRNLLIYLDQAVQRKIIQMFHFALRDGGCLFLGSAETICGQDNLFEPLSQKWRVYRKLGVTTPVGLDLPLRPQSKPAVSVPPAYPRTRLTLPSITHQAIAERYGPAAAVVDRTGALLYTHGNVRDFLELPVGETTGLLADAAREGLRNRLSGAVAQAVAENKRIAVQARVRKEKKSLPVKVTVSPIRNPREADGLLLVTFEALRPPKAAPVPAEGAAPHSDVRQLEDELKITREELSSTIEQLQQSNEHLKASNEEVTAANEELQSANEELETSKEELQSLNEELNAVNQRLQEKVVELEQASNDVANLLTSGDVATVFLDKELKVRRFTQAITRLLSLVETDLGRPIADIHRKFRDDSLLADAQRVLVNLTPETAEVQADNGDWYQRRILPYRTKDDRIEGVVITFADVTDLKQLADALRCSEESVRQSETRYRELVQNANSAIIRWKRDGTVTFFNEYAQSFFGYRADEMIGKNVGFLVPPQDSTGGDLSTLIEDVLADPRKYANNVNENVCRDGRRVWMAWTNKPILDETGQVAEILAVGMDITERRQVEEQVKQLATFPEQNPNPVLRVDVGGALLYVNDSGRAMLEAMGATRDHPLPQPVLDLVAEAAGADCVVEAELPDRRGRVFWFGAARPAGEAYVNLYIRDVTERKAAEEALRHARDEWERTFDSVPDLIALLDDRHRVIRVNQAMAQRLGLTPQQCVGVPCYQAVHGTDCVPDFCPHARTMMDGQEHAAEVHEPRLGGDFLVTTTPLVDAYGKMTGAVHVARDITEQKRAQRERETAVEFLRLINDAGSTAELVHAAATFFHEKSGCQAVGIRLKEGDDYPYYESRGFPEEFLRAENQLCARDASGQVARDGAGYPIMECMCGNILCGRFDPSLPFFTAGGSFWTNCTTELLAGTTEADRQARTRNRCNGEGYESVALVPLRAGREALGLLQLNDKRKGLFSPQTIALWERLAGYLAVALAKSRAEEALQTTLDRFYTVLSSMYSGILLVTDDGHVEFANQAFCDRFGLAEAPADLVGLSSPDMMEKIKSGYLHPEEAVARIREILATRQPVRNEELAMRDGGACLRSFIPLAVGGQSYGRLWVHIDITDRKRAEQEVQRLLSAVQDEKERLSCLLNSINDEVWFADTAGKFTLANPAAVREFNLSSPDGTDVAKLAASLEVLRGDGSPRPVEESPPLCALGGEVIRGEEEIIRTPGTGELRHRQVSAAPVRDARGSIIGSVSVVRDITDRKRAEEAVLRSQKTFSELVESAPFGIYVVDSQLRVAQMNVGSQNGAFRNVRPIIGRDFSQAMRILWPEPVAAEIIAAFRHTLDTGEPYYSPRFMNPRHDVEAVEAYEWELHRMALPDGQFGVVCYYFDSTRLREAEKALLDANEQLEQRVVERTAELTEAFQALRRTGAYTRSLIEASLDPLVTIGPDGTITDVNAATEAATGRSRKELVGTDFSTYFTDPDKARAGYRQVFQEGSVRDYPLEIRHADGHTVPVLYNAALYRDEGGQVVGVFAAARDITERRRAETALREAYATLERRVAERTAELARSNEELSQFAYVASHDLQEPLRMVGGFLKLLEDRYKPQLDEKAREYISFSVEGAARMSQLITDLLAYSRVGRGAETSRPTDANEALAAALANLQGSIRESGATVTHDDLPTVKADSTQLMQLLQNLVGNAVKFRSPDRPCQIHVGAEMKEGRWVFFVRDNGIGIDPGQHERVFVIFQRLHTREQYAGTGIGLAICKKIVERHGGRIWVTSKPGEGSTFFFALPA